MLRRSARSLLQFLDRLAAPLAARSAALGALYYLITPGFRREQRAVLAGREAYRRALAAPATSSPLLRRNVHRLEKGLVMVPREPVFADDYVGETVAEYERATLDGSLDGHEMKWARDVLAAYFAVVSDTPRIAAARQRWLAAEAGQAGSAPGDWRPRAREEGVRSGVDYEQFLLLCRQRRSVRWFLPDPVPDDLVARAAAAAAQAPSACNRQPFVFRYIAEPARAAEIAGIAMGTVGYADKVPALIVVLGDLSAYPSERDRHLIYIDGALAAMQFMLALETLGLASCPINWPDIESYERRMDERLELPAHLRPVMLIALGFPDPAGGVPYSAKKPVEALLQRETPRPRPGA